MKLSELIAALENLRSQHGDCLVVIDDADTNWPLAIDTIEYDPGEGRVSIGGEYHSKESTELRS
jgi:hypothetical protein